MRLAPRLWGILAVVVCSFLGPAVHVVRAEEVNPALLDACPGYKAANVTVDGPKLTAKLVLAGNPCNVFGKDIEVLELSVVYETGMSHSHNEL
jgi:alpha-glucosidase